MSRSADRIDAVKDSGSGHNGWRVDATLLDGLSAAVLAVDETSRVRYANPAAESLLGSPGQDLLDAALPSLFASLKQSPCASPVRSPVRSGAPSAAGGVALAIAPPSPFSPHQVNFTPKKPAKHAVPSLPLSRGAHPHQQPDLLRCSPPRLAVPLPAHSPARIRTPRKLDLAPKHTDPLVAQPAPVAANVAVAAPLPPFRRGIARRDRRSFGHLRIYES